MNTPARGKRILFIATDAYGGTGGIALYSRDAIEAMCADPAIAEVVCVPRVIATALEPMPAKLVFDTAGARGKVAFVRAILKHLRRRKFDLVYCAHVNLIPVARLAAKLAGAPWMLCLYGIEAWTPSARRLSARGAAQADSVVSLSEVTLERFLGWCPIDPARCVVVPNAVHLEQFSHAPKDVALAQRLGLGDGKTIMTLGRLDPSEQAKGFDRTIAALPELRRYSPGLKYLIVGKGGDQPHLERLATQHGVRDAVIFAGFVSEADKPRYYGLADAYVMPSTGEGFGFVFLEALACGVPAVGSATDGGRDALREGMLGELVDPFDQPALIAAIMRAIEAPHHVPQGLDHFDFPHFAARLQKVVTEVIARA